MIESPQGTKQRIKVAHADDGPLFREGLEMLLRAGTDFDFLFSAPDGDTFLELLKENPPDVAILDLRMPPEPDGGMSTAEYIKRNYPQIGVFILSHYAESSVLNKLLQLKPGGVGYILKESNDLDTLRDTVERVYAGEVVIDKTLLDKMFTRKRSEALFDQLTQREREILALMAEGRSNSGIARTLAISTRTAENLIARIFQKLEIPADTDDNRRVHAVLSWLNQRQEA